MVAILPQPQCAKGCSCHTSTQGGLLRHNCVIIGLGNGFSPVCYQAIASTNDKMFSFGTLGVNVSEIFIKIHTGFILWMRRANGRWCYFITSSPIGWAHTQKDPSTHNFFQVSMNNIYHFALQFNHFTVFVCSDCIVRKRCSYITNELELHFFHTYLLSLTYWGAKCLKFRKQNFQLHFLSMKMFEI